MFRNYNMINGLMNKKEFKNIIFKQFIDAPNVIKTRVQLLENWTKNVCLFNTHFITLRYRSLSIKEYTTPQKVENRSVMK